MNLHFQLFYKSKVVSFSLLTFVFKLQHKCSKMPWKLLHPFWSQRLRQHIKCEEFIRYKSFVTSTNYSAVWVVGVETRCCWWAQHWQFLCLCSAPWRKRFHLLSKCVILIWEPGGDSRAHKRGWQLANKLGRKGEEQMPTVLPVKNWKYF